LLSFIAKPSNPLHQNVIPLEIQQHMLIEDPVGLYFNKVNMRNVLAGGIDTEPFVPSKSRRRGNARTKAKLSPRARLVSKQHNKSDLCTQIHFAQLGQF